MMLEQRRAELHSAVQRIALQAYLRQGFVPSDIKELLAATASAAALMKHRPDQPRIPAGSPEGGRWVSDSGRSRLSRPSIGDAHVFDLRRIKPVWKEQSNERLRAYIADKEQPGANDRQKVPHFGYLKINHENGVALGRYQFRNVSLIDLGLKDKSGKWRKDTLFYAEYRISSDRDFLRSAVAQEDVMTAYLARQDYLSSRLYQRYGGYTYQGFSGQRITVTKVGLIAAAHRVGTGDIERYLRYVVSHGGTYHHDTVLLNRLYKPIETRLREAQDIPYTPTEWPATIPNPHAIRNATWRGITFRENYSV